MVNRMLFLLWFYFQCAVIFSVEGFDFSELGSTAADFKIIVKDVGQGSCTIIENQHNGKITIIDTGSSASTPFNLDDEIVKELGGSFVRRSMPPMDGDITLVISHSDQDHIDGLHSIFSKNSRLFAYTPRILLGDHFTNYYKSSDSRALLRRIIGNFRDPSIQAASLSHNIALTPEIITAENDSVISSSLHHATYYGYREHVHILDFLSTSQYERGHIFEVLSANAGAKTRDIRDENANSAVVRLCIYGENILVMGDATGLTTQRILLTPGNRELLKKVGLLVSSHHGGRLDETNNGLWLVVTKPKRVAISAGYHGGYRHPNAEFFIDLTIIGSLAPDIPHDLALSGAEENLDYYVESLMPHMAFKSILEIQNKEKTKIYKWLNFTTQHAVHSTGSSGSLYYTYNTKGELVSFWKEN